jgi:hypothetical protein
MTAGSQLDSHLIWHFVSRHGDFAIEILIMFQNARQKDAVIIQDMERPSRLSFRPEETRSAEADVETGLLKLDVPNEALKQD